MLLVKFTYKFIDFFPAALQENTDTVEVITKSMTAAPSGLLLLLAHVQWAPRLATKTV